MTPILLQADRLPLFYQAVREQFNQGGTFGSILIVLAGLVALVSLAYFLNRLEQRATAHSEPSDAQRLFRDLVVRLGLNDSQRHLLDAVAKDLRLKNPTVLLLSERAFDRYVQEWSVRQKDRPPLGPAEREQIVSRMRGRLFPGGAGFVSSTDWVR